MPDDERKTTASPSPAAASAASHTATWLTVLGVGVLAIAFIVIETRLVSLPETAEGFAKKILQGGALALLFLVLRRLLKGALSRQVVDASVRFNLERVLDLTLGLVLFFVLMTLLFSDWYTAAVSLGLLSVILGFALQTPITSFIGWIYILVRKSFRVGDRIRVGDITGDVIDLSYLDTTILEVRGDYLTGDHPSGRIIKFPNLTVLSEAVYNYTTISYPFIWNEIKVQLAYQSDLELVTRLMTEVVERELGPALQERLTAYRDLLNRTMLGETASPLGPLVFFTVSDNTWVEAIVRYVVKPHEAETVKTRLIRKLLHELNQHDEKVLLPKSNMR